MKEHFKSIASDRKFRQRKFLFAIFYSWVITLGLIFDKLTGAEFNMGMLVVLGMYGAQSYFGSASDRGEEEG